MMKLRIMITLVGLGLMLLLCPTANGDTLVLQEGVDGYAGTSDTVLLGGTYGQMNYGGGGYLAVKDTGGDDSKTSLVRFDLAGLVPAGQTITSAKLEMYQQGSTVGTVSIHRVLRSWLEGDGNGAYNEGASWQFWWNTSAHTWTGRTDGARGCLGTGDMLATATDTETTGGGWSQWDVTVDVQALYADPTNSAIKYGWVLQTNTATQLAWNSSEWSNPPKLTIEYTPEPATMSLLGVGGVLALIRRRR